MKKIRKAALLPMILGCVCGGVCATSAAHPAQVMAEDVNIAALQERIENAKAGDVIKLERDETESIIIKSGQDIVLDLNGHTLSNLDTPDKDTVKVELEGILKVTDSSKGIIGNVKNVGKATAIFNNGTFTLENAGVVNEENITGYTIVNHGIMRIVSGSVISYDKTSALIENGYYNYYASSADKERVGYCEGINMTNPSLVVDGGMFCGGNANIKVDDGAFLTVNDGYFSSGEQTLIMNMNQCVINGGKFKSYNMPVVYTSRGDNWTINQGKLNINGGSFNGASAIKVGNNEVSVKITDGDFKSVDEIFGNELESLIEKSVYFLKISGGEFPDTDDAKRIVNRCATGDAKLIKFGDATDRISVDKATVENLLTDEDKVKFAGKDMKYFLEIKEISAAENVEVFELLKKEAEQSGLTIGRYYDINLLALESNSTTAGECLITRLKGGLNIDFSADNLVNEDKGKNRIYSLVHAHFENDVPTTEVIEGNFNKDTNTVTCSISSFSEFALSYKDINIDPQEDDTKSADPQNPVDVNGSTKAPLLKESETSVGTPKTGDNINMSVSIMTLSAAAAGVIFALAKYKKTKEN